jgi:hypothetical protein
MDMPVIGLGSLDLFLAHKGLKGGARSGMGRIDSIVGQNKLQDIPHILYSRI